MNTLAFIPARGGSKRLPHKNIKEFLGEPIIAYPIRYLQQIGLRPIVSTDDAEIGRIAEGYGAEVVTRPLNLADDRSTTTEVLMHYIESTGIKPDLCLMLHPTSVFATPDKLNKAFELIKDGNGVFPMIQYGYPPQRGVVIRDNRIRMSDESAYFKRTQDFEPTYHDAGQFYLLRTDDLLLERRLFLSRSVPMIVKESEAQDVDNEEDWKMAEIKYEIMMGSGRERK